MSQSTHFTDRLAAERARMPRILVVENEVTLEALRQECTVNNGRYELMGCELLLQSCKNIDIVNAVRESGADGLLMRMGATNEAIASLRRLKVAGVNVPSAVQIRGQIDPLLERQTTGLGALGLYSKKDATHPGLRAVRDAVLAQGVGVA